MDYTGKYGEYLERALSQQLTEESPRADQPSCIRLPLKIHQRALLSSARELEGHRPNGIDCGDGMRMYTRYGFISDRVGSGKSLVALSLCGDERRSCEMILTENSSINSITLTRSVIGDNFRLTNQIAVQKQVAASLIVVPHGLIGQWANYLKDHTTLRGMVIKSKVAATAADLLENIAKAEVVIVSSTMWAAFNSRIMSENLVWRRFFLDEADTCLVSIQPQSINANFYWFISASWLNLLFPRGAHMFSTGIIAIQQNGLAFPRLQEFLKNTHGHLHIEGIHRNNIAKAMIAHPDLYSLPNISKNLHRLLLRNSEDFIQQSLQMPEVIHSHFICDMPPNMRILDNLASDATMQMLHAGDVAGAIASLGMQEQSPESVVEAVTMSLKKELAQNIRVLEFKKTMDYSTEAIKRKAIETSEKKVKQLEDKIASIEDRIKNIEDKCCPICYCEFEKPTMTPCCKNVFCFPCIAESLRRAHDPNANCPLCRGYIAGLKSLQILGEDVPLLVPQAAVEIKEKISKAAQFMEFVLANPTAKILLFSGYEATFGNLRKYLNEANVPCALVNGTNARISKLIREFESGTYRVLFLNARYFGAGLNITPATHVVLYHRMSKEMEAQIVGRAYRLGRTAPLNVLHLLHPNENEALFSSDTDEAAGAVIMHL